MRVNFGNQNNLPKKPNYAKSIVKGVALSTGLYSVATASSSIAQPDSFRQAVAQVGGKAQYAKTFAIGLGIVALGGALISSVVTAVASKIKPSEKPKAN